ncbi:DNA-binding transcriptional LysR family regulator [Kitasatospora sp. GAS204A]|uniref:LysR substrate-binding domain-containing protein n=1 Tax=unclassified Kitasatospora TaxID=2633591 RepID=UPI00247327D9|nr:LysR substrate-binding domain-containing protein [Kitasatospora sp. GAS204B]MDH6121780.1 DNA-binding transcriptional LysR family regulator [Kitasatospora sp. GAS204B]
MFDPVQLRSFLAVAQTGGFTRAAQRLGLRQSTVSQHVRRLEEATGRRLFHRDTHTVQLTAEGEAMLGFARSILAAHGQAAAYFADTPVRGRVRFGASEDFVLTELPQLLRTFRRGHPEVDLELTVGRSALLYEQLADSRLDLVLGKRLLDRPADGTGPGPGYPADRLVWRDRLVWIGAEDYRPEPGRPVPLIVYPPPSLTRSRALDTLDRAGRPWHIACTSASLSGVRAAALAGLGVVAHAQGMIPPGLRVLPPQFGLPDLGATEFVLSTGRTTARGPAAALADAILAGGDHLQRLGGPLWGGGG